MNISSSQLQTPADAILFDCDGTLSAIEGVNELARAKGVYTLVEALTKEAMDKTGLTPQLFQKRLELIKPNHQDVVSLSEHYITHCVPDAKEVIELLQRMNKFVYIVSAGLNPAVNLFGHYLQIPDENIYAVDLQFDNEANYLNFDHTSPLINNDGKRIIVKKLQEKHAKIIHIGDALNDYVTHDIVTRFIGFGGVYYREHLAKRCQYYIRTLSLAPLLPLALTQSEVHQLTSNDNHLYQKGLTTHTSS